MNSSSPVRTIASPKMIRGLSITKALIDLLSASIFVESEPGKGSKFDLIFPKPDDSEIQGDVSDEGNEFLFDADETF